MAIRSNAQALMPNLMSQNNSKARKTPSLSIAPSMSYRDMLDEETKFYDSSKKSYNASEHLSVTSKSGENGQTVATNKKVVLGDFNNDGKISLNDIAKLELHLSGKGKFSSKDLEIADINQDDRVDAADINLLELIYIGNESLRTKNISPQYEKELTIDNFPSFPELAISEDSVRLVDKPGEGGNTISVPKDEEKFNKGQNYLCLVDDEAVEILDITNINGVDWVKVKRSVGSVKVGWLKITHLNPESSDFSIIPAGNKNYTINTDSITLWREPEDSNYNSFFREKVDKANATNDDSTIFVQDGRGFIERHFDDKPTIYGYNPLKLPYGCKGKEVTVHGFSSDGWADCTIRFSDGKEYRGWIISKYISPNNTTTDVNPSKDVDKIIPSDIKEKSKTIAKKISHNTVKIEDEVREATRIGKYDYSIRLAFDTRLRESNFTWTGETIKKGTNVYVVSFNKNTNLHNVKYIKNNEVVEGWIHDDGTLLIKEMKVECDKLKERAWDTYTTSMQIVKKELGWGDFDTSLRDPKKIYEAMSKAYKESTKDQNTDIVNNILLDGVIESLMAFDGYAKGIGEMLQAIKDGMSFNNATKKNEYYNNMIKDLKNL